MVSTNIQMARSGAAATNALRDIKPPVDIPNGWMLFWAGLGALVIGAALFLLIRWWLGRRHLPPPVPVVPAHVQARRRLEAALALIGRPREFCIAVSDALRWYLEQRFAFHAPERTTEEFLDELGRTTLLNPQQKASLTDFLQRCDLVKFARHEPAEPELRDLLDSALRLVDETVPMPSAAMSPGMAASPVTA